MNLLLLLLAQAPPVEKAIGWAERASQLGVAGLAIFIMFCALGIAFWQFNRNSNLHAANAELEKEFRKKTEDLLREMLERGEDSQEAMGSNTQAVRDMTLGMQQLTTRIEYVERALHRPGGGVP